MTRTALDEIRTMMSPCMNAPYQHRAWRWIVEASRDHGAFEGSGGGMRARLRNSGRPRAEGWATVSSAG